MMTSALQELSIEDLENTLEQAQQRYARLRAQASKRAFKNVLQTYEGEKLSLPQSSTSNENTASQISDKAAKNSKRRRVEATHVAYRIAGHTIFPVAPHKSGIRFDTSCFGKYHEQYYVFLHFADDTTVTVFKHTLPPFIRVEEQAKDLHTDAGLKKFMLEISTNLNAYVHRREQVYFINGDCLCEAITSEGPAPSTVLFRANGAAAYWPFVCHPPVCTAECHCASEHFAK
eukprot:m.297050 g.297050  ORF g.297050 m.297050 type:complete len:231 (+) comp20074_c0_seq1:136-828(+)